MPGVDTGAGSFGTVSTNRWALTGTAITEAGTQALAMQWRTHRAAKSQQNVCELWYEDTSDGSWNLFPAQPLMEPRQGRHPTLYKQYQQPAVLEFSIPDSDPTGVYTPQNQNSAANLNHAGQYDPLFTDARKIVLRAGSYCWNNVAAGIVPTSSLAPDIGALSFLTDGLFGDVSSGAPTANYAQFAPSSGQVFTLTVDLGAAMVVRHAAVRFATRLGICSLPAWMKVSLSTDGSAYVDFKTRPVGGNGLGSGGDWNEDLVGRNVEIPCCDVDQGQPIPYRYVRFTVGANAAETIYMDEIAVYGGSARSIIGRNVFTGYLGDDIEVTSAGLLQIVASDVSRKLAQNNDNATTDYYHNWDLADILYDLMVNPTYWLGSETAFDAPFVAADIGWTSGSKYSAFTLPAWQGTSTNLLAMAYELAHEIGWSLTWDGNGVAQMAEPTYRQRIPDRVMIADPDGNGDVRSLQRHIYGRDIRNNIKVRTANPNTGSGAALTTVFDPASVSRYGHRTMAVVDALFNTAQLRTKVGQSVLRDYAWRDQTLSCEISPDADLTLKGIHGFRASGRPCIYPKASRVAANLRLREYWAVETIEEHIATGDWWAACDCVPFAPRGPAVPTLVSLTPGATTLQAAWSGIDSTTVSVNIYTSAQGALTGFSLAAGGVSPTSPYTLTGLLTGTTYWVFITAVDDIAAESFASNILSATTGSGTSVSGVCWTVSDLAVAYHADAYNNLLTAIGTYPFSFTFSSPTCGLVHAQFCYALGTPPADPADPAQWKQINEWSGVAIPAGKNWDRVSAGPLNYYARATIPALLVPSGTTVYFCIFTYSSNTIDQSPYQSNVASLTMP